MTSNLSPSRWLVSTCLGSLLGLVLGVVLLPLTAALGFGVGIGLGLGLLQARALNHGLAVGDRRRVNSVAWVAISALGGLVPGWLVAFALILGASNGGAPVRDAMSYISGVSGAVASFGGFGAGICGGLVGLLHGRLLRGGRTGWGATLGWAALSAAGWAASWAAQGGGLGLLITGGQAGGLPGYALVALGGLLVLAGWAPYALLTAPLLAARGTDLGAPEAATGPAGV